MNAKTEKQAERARRFLKLHKSKSILLLPNAWDVVSAKIYELEGFGAIGTTSAGIAASLGFPDGQKITRHDMLNVTRRIASNTLLPVSADIEAGYADTIDGVVKTVSGILDTGAVGINIEDSTGIPASPLYEVNHQAERIAVIRQMADSRGIHLVINARTDAFMLLEGKSNARISETIMRASVYVEAGADCIFVPDLGDLDKDNMKTLVREINAPLNIIAGATTPSITELESIGVARVSFGPRMMRIILAVLRNMARDVKRTGSFEFLSVDSLTYSEVNAMFDFGKAAIQDETH